MPSPGPATLVIFGVTGDLSKRYLLPALYHLCKDGLLPEHFEIVGTSRQNLELDEFLEQVELCVLEQDKACDPTVLKQLRARMRLTQLNPVEASDYARLKQLLDTIETDAGVCMNRLYYLSIPPQLYEPVIGNLGEQDLQGTCQHGTALTRLLVEKPFGYDLTSAEELIEHTARFFSEEQLYRIDHYLAKETAQNILLFRRRNTDIEARWNSKHIRSIAVEACESIGVEGRKFYDQIGALRDLVQSHLLQLLALVTLELPTELDSRHIHEQKEALLKKIGPFPADKVMSDTVRGQYESYTREVDNQDSTTETFAAIRLHIPSERWQGTEVLLATGKALGRKLTGITVNFHSGEQVLFRVQPEAGIEAPERANTDFSDVVRPVNHAQADAYERVLLDAMLGDRTLFISASEVLACWRIVQPVLDEWAKGQPNIVLYKKGTSPNSLLNTQ